MSPATDPNLPPIASISDLVDALRLLGVGVGIDETVPTVGLGLAYSTIGAAERNAHSTEQHARHGGAGPTEFAKDVGAILDGAACHSDLEVLALLEWRITRTTQAIQLLDLTGPRGAPDPLMRSIILTSAALAGLLAAAVTMRNPHRPDGETSGAARGLRGAIKALDEAARDIRQHDVTAQLLDLTD